MKITELLNKNTPLLSFEVFPPKTETAFESVKTATEEIAKLRPAFMSVTYGAGGGTSRYTLDIAKNIKGLYGVPTLAHLTCVSSTRETVKERIADIKEAGIENVMALRGDLPKELEGADRSGWDYKYAIDLVKELKAADGELCIGGACYPEIHPESATQKDDIKRLKEKVDYLIGGVGYSCLLHSGRVVSEAVDKAFKPLRNKGARKLQGALYLISVGYGHNSGDYGYGYSRLSYFVKEII